MLSRVRLLVSGTVQGVGFRPHVYRLAAALKVAGWVANDPRGVLIEAEGEPDQLERFIDRLVKEPPAHCAIRTLERERLAPLGGERFEIRTSEVGADAHRPATLLPPDLAMCEACRRELFDPADRRYRYPFINCTDCGPRYTIIEAMPYDRPNTVMRRFAMCQACLGEYHDSRDRRFHAQPIACPDCGPQLALWDDAGRLLAKREQALPAAVGALNEGRIVAVKGLGGFHLMVDGRDEAAVRRLRERKRRPDKPFALLFPSLDAVEAVCEVSPLEARLLCSPEAPIVLLRRRPSVHSSLVTCHSLFTVAPSVAPSNPYLGIMLPSTPLHHLLVAAFNAPIVATSGNASDEPICIDEEEALARLQGIADCWLVHDRPIVRPVDDSVVRVALDRPLVLRRARGYAPGSVPLQDSMPPPIIPMIAMGGHMKNTVAMTVGAQAVISQHLGDLGSVEGCALFQRTVKELPSIHQQQPVWAVCDQHPDYRSTVEAGASGLPVLPVQHHHAHIAACMAEHQLRGPVLGVAWDGTGYGPDGTIWGGEFLLADAAGFERAATFRPFRSPGGERAVREPWRTAVGLLHELWGPALFEREELAPLQICPPSDRAVLRSILAGHVHAPQTSSVGRLFDAVASLIGLRQRVSYDGQAAMELEWAAEKEQTDEVYPFTIAECRMSNDEWRMEDGKQRVTSDEWRVTSAQMKPPRFIVDWGPMIEAILAGHARDVQVSSVAAKFHNTLVEIIMAVAQRVAQERVVLAGGCFQNRILLEGAVRRLRAGGFRPFWPDRLPPNDGGLALGQLYVAMGRRKAVESGEWKVESEKQNAADRMQHGQ
jgi:hydrogenase maturation protein HypF